MIADVEFRDFSHFCEWYAKLNPNDPIDKQEAMIIYFNLETYGEQI